MIVTLGWLKSFVEVDLPPNEVGRVLTMAGLELDAVENPGEKLKGLLTGHVLSVKPHPDADALSICEVEAGSDVVQVVCGAPNVREGMVSAFAPVGSTLPGGMKIKEAKLRGQISKGMLCSVKELELGDDHTGIWDIGDEVPSGEDLATATMMDDVVFDFSVTANRGDCLSVIGIARDLAAIVGSRVRPPKYRPQRIGGKIDDQIKVDIKAPELCRRYTGMMVTGVKIAPSPIQIASRLRMVGIRPINNIVDVTNYILMEWGQPLHAFDYDRLVHHHIVVRRANDGETIETLDGIKRKLTTDNLLICDGEEPVALAGVMGGQNTEVVDDTHSIFIESAYFDPVCIRKTSAAHGLSTESSYRFERGVDSEGVVHALHCAAMMMEETGQGSIINGYIDNHPKPLALNEANLRVDRTNQVLGMNLSAQRISEILLNLGMEIQPVSEDLFRVTVPSYRNEVKREIDLIEEIARIEGYDKIPTTNPKVELQPRTDSPFRTFKLKARKQMLSLGFQEAINLGFDRPERLEPFWEGNGEATFWNINNPATEEASVMRTSLTAGLVKTLKHNVNFGIQDIQVFELRPVFLKGLAKEQLNQSVHLAGLISGKLRDKTWNQEPKPVDFFVLKGMLEVLLDRLGLDKIDYIPCSLPFLHPGKGCHVVQDGQTIGVLGALHPDLIDTYDFPVEPYIFELDMHVLHKLSSSKQKYVARSKFPPVLRDLAVVVEDSIPSGNLLKEIENMGLAMLREVKLFDVYQGDRMEKGTKSIAFSFRYQADDRSLTDKEVGKLHDKIVKRLQDQFSASLRE